MQTARVLCLGLVLFACSGCVVSSLHPLYGQEAKQVAVPLEGSWEANINRWDDSERTWTISRVESDEDAYEIRMAREEGTPWTCFARVFRLGDDVFLDTVANPLELGPGAIYGHQFFRLKKWEEGLALERCVPKKLKVVIEKGAAVAAEETEWGLVLTSKTPALQAFFKEHADEVFGEPTYLKRRAAKVQ